MIILRLIALFVGALLLVAPPLAAPKTGMTGMPALVAVGGLAGLALVACSFLYVGVFGNRMRRSGVMRALGGLLLLVPAGAGAAVLATQTDPVMLWCSGLLMSVTVMLFVSFVYPATPERRQRPMRRRERSEPAIILVQRHPSVERRGSGA